MEPVSLRSDVHVSEILQAHYGLAPERQRSPGYCHAVILCCALLLKGYKYDVELKLGSEPKHGCPSRVLLRDVHDLGEEDLLHNILTEYLEKQSILKNLLVSLTRSVRTSLR